MRAELRAWHVLGDEADRAATKCECCGKFGHDPTDCPDLAHVTKHGVSVEVVTTDRQINRAFALFLLVFGFFAGVGTAKLLEAIFS